MVLAHVRVSAAVELDDASRSGGAVGGELLVVDGPRGGDVEDPPAGVVEALLEVDLLRVDEEVGVQVADLSAASRRTSIVHDWTQPTSRGRAAFGRRSG